MKKKIILLIMILVCMLSTKKVNAEAMPCTWEKDFPSVTGITLKNFSQSTITDSVKIGDRIYVRFNSTGKINSDVKIKLYFVSTTDSQDKISMYLKDISPATGTDIPTYSGYYKIPEEAKVGTEYRYYSLGIFVNDKSAERKYIEENGQEVTSYSHLFCGRYVFNSEDLEAHESWNASILPNSLTGTIKSIKVSGKKDQTPATNLLNYVTIDRSDVYVGGTMNFTVSLTEPVRSVTLGFMTPNGNLLSLPLPGDYSNKTQFTAMSQAPSAKSLSYFPIGTYELYQVHINDLKGNSITYSKGYTVETSNLEYNLYHFPFSSSMKFNLKMSDYIVGNESDITISALKFQNENAVIGSTIPLTTDFIVGNKRTLKSVHINFYDETTNSMFSSYLKSLDKNSYISIPSIVKEGTYKIDSIVFTVDVENKGIDTIVIKNTIENERYKDIFNQKLVVTKDNNKNVLYFSTEDLNEIAYETIKNSQENSVIIIDADYQTVIPSELFDAIKETPRQLIVNYQKNEWIINGVDVITPKSIDVSMKFYSLNKSDVSDTLKSALDDETIVLEFPENGQLPGTTLIRLKDKDIFDKLKSDKYYIYYVDEKNDKLKKVASELQKSYDGYVEFYINHNSKYVISSKKVNDDKILGADDTVLKNNTALTNENKQATTNNIYLYILIGVSAFIIILLIIIIFVLIRKKDKK